MAEEHLVNLGESLELIDFAHPNITFRAFGTHTLQTVNVHTINPQFIQRLIGSVEYFEEGFSAGNGEAAYCSKIARFLLACKNLGLYKHWCYESEGFISARKEVIWREMNSWSVVKVPSGAYGGLHNAIRPEIRRENKRVFWTRVRRGLNQNLCSFDAALVWRRFVAVFEICGKEQLEAEDRRHLRKASRFALVASYVADGMLTQ